MNPGVLNKALIDKALAGLSKAEYDAAMQILGELANAGESTTLEDLKFGDYAEIPVDIDTFLDDPHYLGQGLWITDEFTGERRCTVFPYWREVLKKIFPDNITTAVNTVILAGAIGIGKTFAGVLIQLYLLYRMLCLKDPYAAWGMQPVDKITFSMMNITIEAAEGVGWSKLQELIQSSPWFMEHGNMNASRTNPTWQPPKGVELVFGSSNRTVVGRALFCLDGDTIIATSSGDKKLVNLVDKNIEVISVDDYGNKIISNTCTVKPTIKTDIEYQIELEDGTLIKCTPNHRFLLENGVYEEAQYLTAGTKLAAFTNVADQIAITNITVIVNKSTKQYYDVIEAAPYNNFFVKTNTGYIVSHNCNLTDEVNFSIGSNVEKQKAKQRKLIAQIDARMRSRFLRGTYLPTVNIIISSADTEQAFLQSYIEQKRQNESKTTLIVEEPQWVVDPRKGTPDDHGAFYVAIGNKFLAHELLPVDASEEMVSAYREKGYQMIKIPPGYHEVFLDNLDQALMDIVGLASSSSTKYISGIRLNQIKTDEYKNPFTKDVIEVGNAPDDYNQYSNFFDISRVNPRDIARPLFIHLDMSLSGDKTGIAGTWITGKRPGVAGEESTGRELEFKAAFSVSVKAPKGYQVSFEKTRNFIRWLRDRGFAVKAVSMDTYQSANMAQSLVSDGFKAQVLSVDRVDNAGLENGRPIRICKPYAFFKSAIYEHHLKLYHKCDLLTEEITNLERLSDGHIDHPSNGGSKDQADALCGSLYTASQYAEEYSYDYGENLDAALDVNVATSDEYRKHQMIAEFQEELAKIYTDIHVANEVIDYQKKQEYEMYQNIMEGIIIL